MKINQISWLLCLGGLLQLSSIPALAQAVGDWQTVPGLASGVWDNSSPNALGNDSTWQSWSGSAWVTQTGKTDGVDYPDNNTGIVTILPGTVLTNNTEGTGITADGVIVDSGATLQFYKAAFTLNHNGATTYDMDVLGAWGISNSTAALIVLNSGATIGIESGASVTNFGASSGDVFGGAGYVTGAITFRNGSTYVQSGTKATSVPLATWAPNSTFIFAPFPSATTGFSVTGGWTGVTFGNFIWNWPTQPAKEGTTTAGEGNVTMAGSFYIANANGQTNENIPGPNATLTVGGNFGLTNVAFFPTASAGTANITVAGNFIVDTTASIKINSASGLGNVVFDGASPQILAINGTNSSPGSWNWTVNSGSTVNLNSALIINNSSTVATGLLNINGTLNVASNGSITGTSNVITVALGGKLNVSAATNGLTLAGGETLTGAGTVTGNVIAMGNAFIHPNLGLPLTLGNNLTYTDVTASNIFNLTSSPSSGNDEIVLNGNNSTLACGNAQIVINSAGTLAASDYVLFNVTGTGGAISGAFNSTPAWTGTTPANSASYSIITSGKQVLLHYGTVASPQPAFSSAAVSGTNLLVHGTNGTAGTYVLLTSTNAASSAWTPVATNVLTAGGNFSFTATNVVHANDNQRFYILRGP